MGKETVPLKVPPTSLRETYRFDIKASQTVTPAEKCWKLEAPLNQASHTEDDFVEAREYLEMIVDLVLKQERLQRQHILLEFHEKLQEWCLKYKKQGLFLPTGIRIEDIEEARNLLLHPNTDVFITGADKLGEFAFRLRYGSPNWEMMKQVTKRLYSYLELNEYLPIDLQLSSGELFYFINMTRPHDDPEIFGDRIFAFYEKLTAQIDILAQRNPPLEMPANITLERIRWILKSRDLTMIADHASDIAHRLLKGQVVNVIYSLHGSVKSSQLFKQKHYHK